MYFSMLLSFSTKKVTKEGRKGQGFRFPYSLNPPPKTAKDVPSLESTLVCGWRKCSLTYMALALPLYYKRSVPTVMSVQTNTISRDNPLRRTTRGITNIWHRRHSANRCRHNLPQRLRDNLQLQTARGITHI